MGQFACASLRRFDAQKPSTAADVTIWSDRTSFRSSYQSFYIAAEGRMGGMDCVQQLKRLAFENRAMNLYELRVTHGCLYTYCSAHAARPREPSE
jgi:hypothetical protein